MASFDDLKPASFVGIEFPWTSRKIHGGLRDHVHEFPHSPGGSPELMGRKLYEIEFEAPFLSKLVSPKWRDLWPVRLKALREKFDVQTRGPLHVPGIGTINAYCYDWGQEATSKIRSGELVSFKFREDQSEEFLVSELIKTSPSGILSQFKKIIDETEALGEDPSAFDQLSAAVDDVLAIRDTAILYSSLVESKISYLTYVCSEADRTIDMFKDPSSWRILEALKELWRSSIELASNFSQQVAPLQKYTLPVEMTITDVSIALYQNAERGMDILKLNAVEDALAIPAGTQLRYYQDAA
jgi:hypothetical protein